MNNKLFHFIFISGVFIIFSLNPKYLCSQNDQAIEYIEPKEYFCITSEMEFIYNSEEGRIDVSASFFSNSYREEFKIYDHSKTLLNNGAFSYEIKVDGIYKIRKNQIPEKVFSSLLTDTWTYNNKVYKQRFSIITIYSKYDRIYKYFGEGIIINIEDNNKLISRYYVKGIGLIQESTFYTKEKKLESIELANNELTTHHLSTVKNLYNGEEIYTNFGCISCHSLGQGDRTGPDFKQAMMNVTREQVIDILTLGENARKKHQHFNEMMIMPAYTLSEEQANMVLEYIIKETGASPKTDKINEDKESHSDKSAIKEKKSEQKYDTFTDPRDGQSYKTIQIGHMVWMAENLNYDTGKKNWVFEKRPYHKLNGINTDNFGNYYALRTAKKACPEGWHLPSINEWEQLIYYMGGENNAGKNMKSDEPGTWVNDTEEYQNQFGFSSVPAGKHYKSSGSVGNIGEKAYYWTSSSGYIDNGKSVDIYSNSDKCFIGWMRKLDGLSVRCVKD